jgi:O-succinylbenzoic acid--CoA ligase
MEATAPFELEEIRREWIDGVSGETFYRQVLEARSSLEESDRLLLIEEANPVRFAVKFFAAASIRRPIVLANPKWGAKERSELAQLIARGKFAVGSISIPTGGTTGGVKLAIHDWASLRAGACAVQAFLGGGPVDACCLLPMHHVSGLMQLVRSFVSGGRICFGESETSGLCLSLVPTQLQRMMEDAAGIRKMRAARVVFIGGAAMPPSVAQKARELNLPVVPVYGMTETAAMIAAIPNKDFLDATESGAVTLGDTKVTIDSDGSIRIRGSSLFKGYVGKAPLDPAEGFRTGDLGWRDAHGRLHLQGRMDQLINTGGEKVDPAEVEAALRELEGIVQARVLGEPDEEWGERVVAYVQLREESGAVFDESAILDQIRQQLSPHKVPKQIVLLRPAHRSGH